MRQPKSRRILPSFCVTLSTTAESTANSKLFIQYCPFLQGIALQRKNTIYCIIALVYFEKILESVRNNIFRGVKA